MERWIGLGVAAVALALVGWNTWTLRGIEARLDALEVAAPSAGAAQARSRARAERRQVVATPPVAVAASDRGASAIADLDLEDPEVRAELATIVEEQQRSRREAEEQERSAQFLDSVHAEVQAFAEAHDLDGPTTDKVLAEITRRHEAWNAVRADVHDGVITWFDARRELQDAREESDAMLRELLGDETFDALDEQLWGDMRGGGGPR